MHWFLDPVTKHYFDFEGRATRQQYWMFFLLNILIAIGVGIVGGIIGLDGILSPLYSLALLLPGIGMSVRRLHDIDKSGWWLLVTFVPILGFFLLLYWMVQPTGATANQFGEPVGGAQTTIPRPVVAEDPATTMPGDETQS